MKRNVLSAGAVRGTYVHATGTREGDESRGTKLLLVGYLDNKEVFFLSNYHAHPTADDCDVVARWFKDIKEYRDVPRPIIKKVPTFLLFFFSFHFFFVVAGV